MKLADQFLMPFPQTLWGNRFGVHDIENGHDLYGPQGHRGTDFEIGTGTAVPVIANGEVVHVLHSVALGNVVVVRHYIAGPNNDVFSGYCHLSSALVREGQSVNRGQTVAKSGSTGTACTGPHLHMTLSTEGMGVEYGQVQDPIPYILARQAPTSAATNFQPKYTTAKRGEGLIAIAARSGITFDAIKKLNPSITAPAYIVQLGQRIRIS